ncbi:protein NYNRIN-like [Helianthus annuus]|uniref:protein NYNRIN-like n=1 Tax=Helianthus annuus TaxID=4232 RepID=UPI000B8FF8D1|nr:protein NYNRIN-like [Helianthus annuus]
MLTGPETRYSMIEKLVLALVHASRRLRRYFSGHVITVLTNYHLGQILSKPDVAGRLAKWVIELGGYNIFYKPRPAIKGQVLADFATEVPIDKVQECEAIQNPTPVFDDRVWTLHTDGASNDDGAGAGLRLVSPDNHELTYAIRLDFQSTNNEAEYEAFLAGLHLALKMGARNLEANVDSKLVAEQVNGHYDAKGEAMALYLEQTRMLISQFQTFRVKHINRSENKHADALSKLAATSFKHLAKEVRIEVLSNPSIHLKQVNVIEVGNPSWMSPIILYLQHGKLPEGKAEARKLQHKAINYEMADGVLYRKSFMGPLLCCVDKTDAQYLVREIHEGLCGIHAGPRMVVAKIMNAGYYWPGMHMDAVDLLRRCAACQRHAPKTLRPKNPLVPVTSAWPFQQWGIDLVGPFPDAPGAVKFIIVAVDYFTKWVEAKALASTTAMVIRKFIWEHIICRFGLPLRIISDNGTNFASDDLQKWFKEMKIEHHFASVAHPQANGQVESVNKQNVDGIKARLGTARRGWVDELPSILWAHRTMPKTSTGETPFSLVYGSEAVIPTEIGLPSPRMLAMEK